MKQLEIVTFHPEDESDLDLNAGLSLDIIAVHGLNGNLLNTWTEPKSQKLWLRDFLPKDLRGARVMTFGYNATPAFENSVAGIKDHARGLLGALSEKRERNFEAKRPLIFIGHSLGGLVIKQALIIAEQESPYRQIYDSTIGIIFFGTPHQGSSLANYATTITRTLLVLTKKPNAELLESLRKGGPALKQLSEDWKAHHERRPYQIVSFYETRTMKGLPNLIVEKSSALLTPEGEVPIYEDQIPVEATHRDICRFATPKNKTYKDVVRKIKRIQQGSEVQVKSEFYVVPHSTSTHFTGRNEVRQKLCDSLVSYQTSKGQQIFVLYGLGGSGKTQISLKFAEDNRDSFWGIFWIDASSEDTAQEGFLNIARACKQKENVESVKRWLSGKKHWLLILDNADNSNLEISSFFPSRDRGTILITTRNPDLQRYNTAGSYKVDKLDLKEAIDLLLKTTVIDDPQDDNVRQVAERIVNELGSLALAIVQAGAIMRQGLCNLDGFCDLFLKQKREVLELGRSIPNVEDYQYSIFTTWEISVEKIHDMADNSAKLALELLKIFSFMHFDNIRKEIFESAINNSMYVTDAPIFKSSLLAKLMVEGWDGLLWGKAMKLLLAFSLITTSHSGLISMHPLVHLWSRERMSVLERTDACQTAMMTLGIASTQYPGDEEKKRLLVPHIDSLLEYGDCQDFTSVPTNEKEVSAAMVTFHMAYGEGGQFQKALRLAQADLNLKKRTLDLQDVDVLLSTCHVGAVLLCAGHYRESAELLEALMQDMPENIHYQIFLYAASSLGGSYNRLEEYQASFDLCTKSMARFESVFAGESPETVALYNVMGETLCGLGRPKEGLIWATKAVLDAQKVWGPTNPKTCKAMSYLAGVYESLRDFRNAAKWREKCITCLEACLGPNHPETIYAEGGLVDIFTLQRRNFFSAKTIIGRRRALLEKTTEQLGENDWQTLACQEQLAKDYFNCGWFKKAKCVQEKWVEVMTQNFGRDDKRTMRGIAELAWTNQWIAARKAMYWWLPQNFFEKFFSACGDVP